MRTTAARPQFVTVRIGQHAADANDNPTGMNLKKTSVRILPLLLAGMLPASGAVSAPGEARLNLQQSSIDQLEQRLSIIEQKLEQLPRLSMRSGVGSVGCESVYHQDPNHTEWVQVNLGQPTPIDQIVLVPTIWRDSETGLDANGFPVQFQILAGTAPDTVGTVIATFDENDPLIPRVAPLVVPCATTASWVRVEASVLSQRKLDRSYLLALTELLIFNGQENVALHQPVTASSVGKQEGSSRKKEFLVDGFVPYIMDAASGNKCNPYQAHYKITERPSILLDLGATYPISRIHLHAFDSADTVPQALPDGHALPNRLVVEGANQADFSDAIQLFEYHKGSINDVGPIIMRRFPETHCRYIRLTVLEYYTINQQISAVMGFAEIEIFSEGHNVAIDQTFEAPKPYLSRPESLLTDGSNLYGTILPIRQWMEQLALRHDLERERPLVAAELNRRYARQKENLHRMSWLVALLAAGIFITLLLNWIVRMRHVTQIKQRFAADLHDELGANLHAIKMLGDLAEDSESRAELKGLLDRSRVFAKRSITAVRYCTNTLEGRGLCKNLPEDMQRSAERLLADMEYHLFFEGQEFLIALSPRKRVDLFFFYKECLANIIRHSGATQADTELKVTRNHLTLTITDNGIGLADAIPASLKRRAHMLGGKLSVESPLEGGTRITLNLKIRKWKLLK